MQAKNTSLIANAFQGVTPKNERFMSTLVEDFLEYARYELGLHPCG